MELNQINVKTYLVLTDKKLGLLINFGMAFLKDGIKRVVHGEVPDLKNDSPCRRASV